MEDHFRYALLPNESLFSNEFSLKHEIAELALIKMPNQIVYYSGCLFSLVCQI